MTDALHIPLTLAGRYRLERELGHGAMGYVYLARDLKHGRHVAVKVLAPHAAATLDADRFLAEIHTAAGLNHPHILTVHDSGEADGRLYYVMPRVEGSSLKDRLDRERRLPLGEAVDIACQVAEGLAYIHARGLVHRDIKPGNILIDASGHAYIADFGLALALSSVSSTRLTASGIALGSPLYMSPEQAGGDEDVDARSDIYALGCVLFEMLAGSPPFEDRDLRRILNMHLTASPPALRARRADIPSALEADVQQALAKDPDDRHATAEAFIHALQRHVPYESGSARRERGRRVVESFDSDGRTGRARGADLGESREPAAAGGRLGRGRVWKWLLAYLVGGWLLIQLGPAVAGGLSWPVSVMRGILLLFALGAFALILVPWLPRRQDRREATQGDPWAMTAATAGALLAAGAIVVTGWDASPGWLVGAGLNGELRGGAMASADGGEVARELDPNRVAVLYFDDRSPDGELDYMAAGLTEALIDNLTGVPGLEVLSKHAVSPYRTRSVPLNEIVNALDAGTVVSGTVTEEGERLHVSIQLVEGASGLQRWSTSFARPSSDLLAVRDRLVDEVARALRERLGYEFQVRRSRQDATSDDAWRLVREGDELLRTDGPARFRVDDREAAIRFLRRADSLYAQAARIDTAWLEPIVRRAEVAELESRIHRPAADRLSREHLERGIDFASAALDRDPTYAPALEMRGRLRYHLAESAAGAAERGLLASAAADLRKALELKPSMAGAWWHLSRVLTRQGWLAEATAAAERALHEDAFLELPEDILLQLFNTAHQRERMDEAIRWCELGAQRYPDAQHFVMCRLYLLVSVDSIPPSIDRGWELAGAVTTRAGGMRRDAFEANTYVQVAKIAARAGRPDSARAMLRRLEAENDGVPDLLTYDVAHLRVMLGDHDEAIPLLQRYVDERPHRAASLAGDWWFRPLQGREDFQALVGTRAADP